GRFGNEVEEMFQNTDFSNIQKILYRPFEERFTYYTGTTKGFHCMPRSETMQHLFKQNNVALICPKQVPDKEESGVFITKYIAGHKTSSAYNINNVFPLYLYPEPTLGAESERVPNLNMEIVEKIEKDLNHSFLHDDNIVCDLAAGWDGTFSPLDILDYIYAVLHSPTYRETYKEFLKIDFPRVPYPKNQESFWKLVELGAEIRQIHLLESSKVEKYITQYPVDGDNVVGKPKYENGKVFINETQYFDNVPQVAWEFYIGGYQPAQKWLKDRKDRTLDFEDILHYQKIIVALTETDRLMKEIDKIIL
ncbi:MAG TPA: DNA methyltransferase, partial [Taishania sp.]|nr:DNA methyltransferase [Taishania sp.]